MPVSHIPNPNKYPAIKVSFLEQLFIKYNRIETDKIDKTQRSKGAKPSEKIKPHISAKNLFLYIIIIVKTESILRKEI